MLSIIVTAIYYLLWIINALIFVRCIFSWFPGAEESRIGSLLVTLTEPALAPVRRLLMRFEFARNLPVDLSPIVAFLIITFLVQILRFL